MPGQHILVAVLWILYGVVHSVLASVGVKNFFRKKMGNGFKHYRLAYTVFAFLSMAAIIGYQLSITSVYLFPPAVFSRVIGVTTTVAGAIVMGICIRKYFMGLSGLRSLVEEAPSTELIISGVHRFVRHPLYSGTFLFVWGLVISFPTISLLITATIITVYTLIALRFEEQKLVTDFGEDYRRYQSTVPKVIPKF